MAEEEKGKKQVQLSGKEVEEIYAAEKQKLNALAQQMNELNSLIAGIEETANAIKELQKQGSSQILVNLGSGMMIEARIESFKKIKLPIPGSAFVEKSPEDALAFLEEQKQTAKKQIAQMQNEFSQIAKQAEGLGQVISTARREIAKRRQTAKA